MKFTSRPITNKTTKLSKFLLLQLGVICLVSNSASSQENFLKSFSESSVTDIQSDMATFSEEFGSFEEMELLSNHLPNPMIQSELGAFIASEDDAKSGKRSKINSPKVQQAVTSNIITEAPFTSTDYYKYAVAVQTGLALKWTSSAVCFQSTYNFLNDLFYTHQNYTGYTLNSVTKTNGDRQIPLVTFNVSQVISKNFASSFYNCYTMLTNGISQTQIWFNSFVDFSDVYTAFLFNLLAQSLKLRSLATNLQTAQDAGDWANFWKSVASLINIAFNFESSNAESLEQLNMNDIMNTLKFTTENMNLEDQQNVQTYQKIIVASAGLLKQIFPSWSEPLNSENKFVQATEKAQKLRSKFFDRLDEITNFSEQIAQDYQQYKVKVSARSRFNNFATTDTSVDYSFGLSDIANIMFGAIEGATSAIPTSTYNFQCGKNVTNSRLLVQAATLDFSQQKQDSGMTNIFKMLQNVDDITINCWLGFDESSNLDSSQLFSNDGILTNMLYNAGFMFTDVLDILDYDYTYTDPFWYYTAFRAGDFLVRFIYREADDL
eukprot:403353073